MDVSDIDDDHHPQASLVLKRKPKSKNMPTCLEIEVLIKIKYGHEGIMIILRVATYIILVI